MIFGKDRSSVQMSRRKGEITGAMNERKFPQMVELPVPSHGFGIKTLESDAFHREHSIPIRHGRGRNEAERFFVRYCFDDAAIADTFRDRFGDSMTSLV